MTSKAQSWFCCLAVLAGCADSESTDPGPPRSGGTLRIAIHENPGALSQALGLTPLAEDLMAHVTPPLARYNEQGRIDYLASHKWVGDARETEIPLRQRWWEDGEPVRAADYVSTKDLMMHPSMKGSERNRFDLVKEFTARDDSTLQVEFLMIHPNRFRDVMLMPTPQHRLVDEPTVEEIWRWQITQRPLSSGPFRFASVEPGEWILVRNEHWPSAAARLERIEIRQMEWKEAIEAFREGRVHVLENLPFARLEDLASMRQRRLVAVVGRSYVFMGWNLRDGRFADIAVRRAVAHAVDIRQVIEKCSYSQGEPARGPLVPAMGIADTTGVFEYDPRQARALLQDRGWQQGDDGVLERRGARLSFHIITPRSATVRRCASEEISRQLAKLGIAVTVRPIPLDEFLTRLERGLFEAFMGVWHPDLGLRLQDVFLSSATHRHNYGAYANAHVDSLLFRLRHDVPHLWRQQDLVDLQRSIYNDQPYLFLFQNPKFVALSPKVQGAEPQLLGTFWDLPKWWLSAD